MTTETMKQEAFDATAAAFGSKATYTGAATTTASWLLSSEFGVLFGLLLGALGLVINLYFQMRRDLREEREHLRRMDRMKSTQPGDLQ